MEFSYIERVIRVSGSRIETRPCVKVIIPAGRHVVFQKKLQPLLGDFTDMIFYQNPTKRKLKTFSGSSLENSFCKDNPEISLRIFVLKNLSPSKVSFF